MKNKEQVLSEDAKFELQLYQALKTYGFILPASVNDVDRFEALYGKTEIDLPVSIKASDRLFNSEEKDDDSIIDFKSPLNMAALVSKEESVDLSFLSAKDEISQITPKSKKKRNKK
jgi:hypothetical protein